MFVFLFVFFVFFKQKTAYEMRISDWSSDVCSSDLLMQLNRDSQATSIAQRAMELTVHPLTEPQRDQLRALCHHLLGGVSDLRTVTFNAFVASPTNKIGRASCRERVCQYV